MEAGIGGGIREDEVLQRLLQRRKVEPRAQAPHHLRPARRVARLVPSAAVSFAGNCFNVETCHHVPPYWHAHYTYYTYYTYCDMRLHTSDARPRLHYRLLTLCPGASSGPQGQ